VSNHLGDTNKKVSDTPRTDSGLEYDDTTVDGVKEFARQLERELTAANAIIRQQQLLDEENLRLKDRIKRLDEAGDVLAQRSAQLGLLPMAIEGWNKAKEVKP
jgi:hypothetical protein